MSVDSFLLIRKNADNLVEQINTSSQEAPETKINLSRQTFSSDIPISLEKNKRLIF